MVSYKYNSFQVDMVNCYWISQFYHKPVRSCSFLAKKKVRFYAGLGVLQTPKLTIVADCETGLSFYSQKEQKQSYSGNV